MQRSRTHSKYIYTSKEVHDKDVAPVTVELARPELCKARQPGGDAGQPAVCVQAPGSQRLTSSPAVRGQSPLSAKGALVFCAGPAHGTGSATSRGGTVCLTGPLSENVAVIRNTLADTPRVPCDRMSGHTRPRPVDTLNPASQESVREVMQGHVSASNVPLTAHVQPRQGGLHRCLRGRSGHPPCTRGRRRCGERMAESSGNPWVKTVASMWLRALI